MGHAYIPGLKVSRNTIVRKQRRLPIPGTVLVRRGDSVRAQQIVARAELPGKVTPVNVMNQLAIAADEVPAYMVRKVGDRVAKGDVIAESRPLFRFLSFLKSTVRSPVEGEVADISEVTGQVLIREPPVPLELDAYVDGEVVEVREREGVTIEATATLIQGIFGVGGERRGVIEVPVQGPDRSLEAEAIGPRHRGRVLVCGRTVRREVLQAARKVGVSGLVAGGIFDSDLRELLGYDIGVAITGAEPIPFTLILTEGFGNIPMAPRTFDLLREVEGREASLSGATQIRAGVLRPEIVVTRTDGTREAGKGPGAQGIVEGTMVRAIRQPWFGRIGRVTALPPQPEKIETEADVRILEVRFEDGTVAKLPRANVEILEE